MSRRPRSALTILAALALLLLAGCARFRGRELSEVDGLLPSSTDDWNTPLRFTRGPGEQFAADFSARTGRLAYVWDHDGDVDVYVQEDLLGALGLPRPTAPHSAAERWPRLSPDGGRVLFVSTRDDSTGDVWLVSLRRSLLRAGPRRLTDERTADDQPCWHPDGRRVFYAAGAAPREPFDLWEMHAGREPQRLTELGGQMPDCSPDGRHLVFVSARDGGNPDLWVMRLSDGAQARLTAGPELDLQPCWSVDGQSVFFARRGLDTNGDGRLDRSDASSIFSVAFSPEILDGAVLPPARQLTPYSTMASHPRPIASGFLYTATTSGSGTAIFALGASGEGPDCRRATEFHEFARMIEAREDADPYRVLMAWQNAMWAATGGDVAFDLPQRDDAAVAWLRAGRTLRELGHTRAAGRVFAEVPAAFPDARLHAGMARVELLDLERRALQHAAPAPSPWEQHLAKARELEDEYRRYAREEETSGRSAEAQRLLDVAASARLEAGRTGLAAGDYAAALDDFEAVGTVYPEQREAGAQASLAAAQAHRLLGQTEVLRDAYLGTLMKYGDMAPYATEAAGLVVEAIVRPSGGTPERLAGLRDLVERYADVRELPALAQNRIGDVFYAEKDYLRATQEYGRTIERFPGERQQVAAAYLAIARIRTEQEDYERAVASFQAMEGAFERSGGRLYRRALRGYASSLLLKAGRELDLGDVPLALGTYSRLLELDPTSVPALRGQVECYARLGRAGEAALRWRPAVKADPRDHRAHYALALAYSYIGPTDWVGDRRATSRRMKIDREALRLVGRAILTASDVPYYHQLRGFLLNRVALATGRAEDKVQALDAYMAALGTSNPRDDPANWPSLLFNVGEGCMLVEQPVLAYEYYRRAVDAGFIFKGARGEAALTRISSSAMAAGDYAYAVQALQRVLAILDDPESASEPLLKLRREAETRDRLALAHNLLGQNAAAVEQYRAYARLIEPLVAADPESAPGYRRNLLRCHRNLAVNLYLAAESGQTPRDDLVEAFELLQQAVVDLDSVVAARQGRRRGPGLITIDVDVALGESTSGGPFDDAAERRLLNTYMARIAAEIGDYADAVKYLKRKIRLYPETPPGSAPVDLLTEQAVVWTQIGGYEALLENLLAAAEAYRRAVELEAQAANVPGRAEATIALGRVVRRMAAGAEAGEAPTGIVAWTAEAHRTALAEVQAERADHLAPLEAELRAGLESLVAVRAVKQKVERP